MRLRYTQLAEADLTAIWAFVAADNPDAAHDVVVQIRAAVGLLRTFPRIGRTGIASDTRELVVPRLPYVVIYRIEEAAAQLVILRVYHAARSRQP